MALEVVWADRALVKLGEILERIPEDRPAVATRVINRMFDMAATLAAHPEMGRQYEPAPGSGLRQLIVGRYGLIYRIDEEREEVQIIALRHEREPTLPSEAWTETGDTEP